MLPSNIQRLTIRNTAKYKSFTKDFGFPQLSITCISTLATEFIKNEVKLAHVTALPIIGSLIPQYSKIPPFDGRKFYEFHPTIRKKYGDFYSLSMPGLSVGLHGTLCIVSDPAEMLKILQI